MYSHTHVRTQTHTPDIRRIPQLVSFVDLYCYLDENKIYWVFYSVPVVLLQKQEGMDQCRIHCLVDLKLVLMMKHLSMAMDTVI